MTNYNLNLTDPGSSEVAVINKITELTDLSRDEATRIVQEQGVIQRNVEERDARRIAGQLEVLGAKVMLLPVGRFELPGGKALFVQINDQNNQSLAKAQLTVKTRQTSFDRDFPPAQSNNAGRVFFLNFSDSITKFFKELPPVWFDVTLADEQLTTIHQAFSWETFIQFPDTVFEIQVQTVEHPSDPPPVEPPTENGYVVSGKVFLSNETAAIGYTVRAYDRDLRSEQLLGEAITDNEGNYRIPYLPEQFRRAEKDQADLRLRVFDRSKEEVTIQPLQQESDTLYNAEPITEIDLHLKGETAQPDTRYENLVKSINPLLDGASLEELSWEDSEFLSREVDFSSEEIFWAAEDQRLTQQTGLPVSIFFAWALQEIGVEEEAQPPALDLAEILARDAATLILEHIPIAIKKKHIPDLLAEPNAGEQLIDQLNGLKEQNKEEPRRVKRRRIEAVGSLAGLNDEETQILQEWELDAALGNVDIVNKLVEEGKISADKKESLNLTLNLSALTNKRTDVVDKLVSVPVNNNQPAQKLKDFTAWNQGNWQNFLDEHDIQPEEANGSVEQYAQQLNRRVEQLYPTDAWFARTIEQKDISEWTKLREIAPLLAETDNLFTADGPKKVDLTVLDNPEEAEKSLQQLNDLTNLYAPLGLQKAFNNPSLSVDEKIGFANQQITLLQTFRQHNPDFDLQNQSFSVFSDSTSLNWQDIPEEEQPRLINTLKREQRLLTMVDSVSEGQLLAKHGVSGAQDIMRIPRQQFLASDIAGNLTDPKAVYARARIVLSEAVRKALVARETSSIFNNTLAGNMGKGLEPLRRLPGYETLFGSASYCECTHCQSIFSLAAYFVDLMRWCEDFIPSWNQLNPDNGNGSQNTLSLKSRRPDLWHLPLTCENTNTLVPTLQIINEVLERFIASEVDDPETGAPIDAADRKAVQMLVYGKLLNQFVHARTLPFNLPHQQISQYLAELGQTRIKAASLQAQETNWVANVLDITQKEIQLITQSRHTRALLAELYPERILGNNNPSGSAPQTAVPAIEVPSLLQALDIERRTLDELISTPYINEGKLAIQQTKSSPEEVQADREVVAEATYQTLDRIHRFLRLKRALPDWTVGDLGLYLREGFHKEIDAAFLERLPHYQFLVGHLDLNPAEVFSLVFQLADMPRQRGHSSLLDERFNPALFTEVEEGLSGNLVFTHPIAQETATNGGNNLADPASLNRLLQALSISDDDFVFLLQAPVVDLEAPLSFKPTLENLTKLYCHATLSKQLGLSVRDLLQAISLCPSLAHPGVTTLAEITDLVDFVVAVQATELTWQDLTTILSKNTQTDTPTDIEAQILQPFVEEKNWAFSRETFALIPEIELPYAHQLFDQLIDSQTVVPLNKTDEASIYRLTRGADLANLSLTLPQALIDKGLSQDDLRRHIGQYALEPIFVKYLAIALAIPAETLGWMLPLVQADLANLLLTDVLEKYLENSSLEEASLEAYRSLIHQLLPWVTLVSEMRIAPQAFTFPEETGDRTTLIQKIYGTNAEGMPTWETVRRLALWQELSIIGIDASSADNEDLEIEHFQQFQKFLTQAGDETLSERLTAGTEEEQATLLQQITQLLVPIADRSAVAIANIEALAQQNGSHQLAVLLDRFEATDLANDADRLRAAYLLRQVYPLLRPIIRKPETTFSATILDKLYQLRQLLQFKQALGVGTDTLEGILGHEYDTLDKAARSLRVALSREQDEQTWAKTAERLDEQVSEQQRDALQVFLLKTFNGLFRQTSDLYHFFLLDTDFGGCARTSRVKAATLSLQLYVHRIGLNLEQTEENEVIKRQDIPEEGWQEWVWLKNYRVWEANRKVFLYPENYLEPDFRDDRSAQFKTLADELLQVELNEDSVEQAYKNYLTQFEKLAQLRIAGAYYDNQEKTLYVFGINNNKECYWRRFERQVHWTPWEKLGFPVDSLYVSPIKFNGKLYLFWLDITTIEIQSFENGTTGVSGYNYQQKLHYAYLQTSGEWEEGHTVRIERKININATLWDFYLESYGYQIDYEYLLENPRYMEDLEEEMKNFFKEELLRKSFFAQSIFPFVSKENNLCVRLGVFFVLPKILQDTYQLDLSTNKAIKLFSNQGENKPSTNYSIFKEGSKLSVKLNKYSSDAQIIDEYFNSNNHPKKIGDLTSSTSGNFVEHDIATNYSGYNLLHINRLPYLMMNQSVKVDLVERELSGWAAVLEALGSALLSGAATMTSFAIIRMTTTLLPKLQEILYNQGIEQFLSLPTQQLQEEKFPLNTVYEKLSLPTTEEELDFNGAMGGYFQELFFHIPFKIAHQLNANQQFKEAQQWLHYIFNPLPVLDSDDPKENFWQYIEFREQSMQSLREQLNSEAAVEAYKKDPFNPFAIARLRLSAFQKAVVMKYIDNLLDWGDYLFAQDTMETVNEANLLYIMASDLLGPRPVAVGDCQVEPTQEARTYANIKKLRQSEFLYEMEHAEKPKQNALKRAHRNKKRTRAYNASTAAQSSIAIQLPTFCIPENKQLLGYWARVEDRLFKLRNCMNLKGVQRQLALFQPPIDPAMLVRARAAGLSVAEVIASVNSPLPLYRFSYLLERAKAYTGQVQSFGNAVMSLLEKKDASRLTLLLSEQQQAIQVETRKIKELRFKEIKEQMNAWEVDKQKNRLRQRHIFRLASENNQDGSEIGGQFGISEYEKNQIVFLKRANQQRTKASVTGLIASLAYAIPQVGAPTAMTFGGIQLGNVASMLSTLHNTSAMSADLNATRSSLNGNHKRRHNEWMQQLALLEEESKQLEIQREILEIRQAVAEQDLAVFDESVAQTQELYEFHKGKFTNEQLYTWLLNETQKMYRETYRTAQEMAKLAEQAYHFERDEDQSIYVQGGHWEGGYQGLLAGERLALQLQRMEQAHIKNDQRHLEIDQTFSLMQIAPEQLLALRSSGSCALTIPEFLFDLAYPGQYRRKIKSVRLTIPCITGPYTNVGVTLTLLGSKIRMESNVNDDLVNVPRAKNESIATSTAQNDGGQFTLDFNGARYLPFEGAGAVESEWQLDLPGKFRPFDYNTIADVLIHITYTAKDGINREEVNQKLQQQFETAAEHGLQRIISLQQEFSNEFHRLLHRPLGETITVNLQRRYFPLFLQHAKTIEITNVHFFLHTSGNSLSVNNFKLTVNDNEVSLFEKVPTNSALETRNIFKGKNSDDFTISQNTTLNDSQSTITVPIAISALGDLDSSEDGQINSDLFKDIIILVDYRATFE